VIGEMPEGHFQLEPRTQLYAVRLAGSDLCTERVALEAWTPLKRKTAQQ